MIETGSEAEALACLNRGCRQRHTLKLLDFGHVEG